MPILGTNRFSKHILPVSFLVFCGVTLNVIFFSKGSPWTLILGHQKMPFLHAQLSFLSPFCSPSFLFLLLGFLILLTGYAYHRRQKIQEDVLKRDADFRRQLQAFTPQSREALDLLVHPLTAHCALHERNPKMGVQPSGAPQKYPCIIDSLLEQPFETQEIDVKQLMTETISIWHLNHPQGKIIFRTGRGIVQTIETNPFLLQVALLSIIAFSAGASPDDAHRVVIHVEAAEGRLTFSFRDQGIVLTPQKRFDFYQDFYPDGRFPVYEDLAVNIENLHALAQKLGGDIDFSGDTVKQENITLLTLQIS